MVNFYERAKAIIFEQRGRELEKEINEKAASLKYESEKVPGTLEVWNNLDTLTEIIKYIPIRCRWDDYAKNIFLISIRDLKKEKRYHPNQLIWIWQQLQLKKNY